MVRLGSIRSIQGGGDGEGFETPRQRVRAEPLAFPELSEQLISASSRVRNDKPSSAVSKKNWANELVERLFLLH